MRSKLKYLALTIITLCLMLSALPNIGFDTAHATDDSEVYTVKGKITYYKDANSSEVLKNATVELIEDPYGKKTVIETTTTDANGNYIIQTNKLTNDKNYKIYVTYSQGKDTSYSFYAKNENICDIRLGDYAGAVEGIIINKTTREPLAGVNIDISYYDGSKLGKTQTDSEGKYRIENIRAYNKLKMKVSYANGVEEYQEEFETASIQKKVHTINLELLIPESRKYYNISGNVKDNSNNNIKDSKVRLYSLADYVDDTMEEVDTDYEHKFTNSTDNGANLENEMFANYTNKNYKIQLDIGTFNTYAYAVHIKNIETDGNFIVFAATPKNVTSDSYMHQYIKLNDSSIWIHNTEWKDSSINYNLYIGNKDSNSVLKINETFGSKIKTWNTDPAQTALIKETETDSSGNYKFENVPNGVYKIVASYNDSEKSSENIIVNFDNGQANIVLDVEVDSPATSTVSGTITNSKDNTPLSNAQVIVKDSEGTQVGTTTTTENGTYTVANLPAGDYTIEVTYGEINKTETFTISTEDKTVNIALNLSDIEIEDPDVPLSPTPVDGKVNGNMPVYGTVNPINVIDVTLPISLTFVIKSDRTLQKPTGMQVVSNCPAPLDTKILSVNKSDSAPSLVAPDTYTDEQWNNLTKAKTYKEIALTLNDQDLSVTGNSLGNLKSAFNAADPATPNSQYLNLDLDVKYGKAWNNSQDYTFTYNTVFEFSML